MEQDLGQKVARERAAPADAELKPVAAWLNQLARTLKTCRLYDSNHPTVVRFREDLAGSLKSLLEEQGPLVLRFTNDDVLVGETSLYPARSRDDNLALPFYQDGIHSLTLSPGIEPGEVEALLEALLSVTGQNLGQDDLVTLLWEAHLDHVDVEYVPSEGDLGAGGEEAAQSGEVVPWPSGFEEESEHPDLVSEADGSGEPAGRSDDWSTGDQTLEVDAELASLESLAPTETLRFIDEHQAERSTPMLNAVLGVVQAAFRSGLRPGDLEEFGRFLPRVLRQAISVGAWRESRQTVELLGRCPHADWSAEVFLQELLQPISVTGVVEKLDHNEMDEVKEFVELARSLGDPALDWLNLALGESQQRRVRRVLAESIAEWCRDHPERLAPWLADPRWYVVRNAVHILGWIGGDGVVSLLQVAGRHPEPRVRQEVVAALAQVEPERARPALLPMLESADTRVFCSVLHQLSLARDPATATRILALLQAESFENRPIEEKRSIYSALSTVSGDEVLPALEAELHKGGWFQRSSDQHRAAVARCIARIGTPAAREILEAGVRSRRGPLKKACEDALAGWSDRP